MSDEYLLSCITNSREKLAKYKRVRNTIMSHNLHTQRSLSGLQSYIEHCQKVVDRIDSQDGYGYLANFRDKLADDIKVLKDYRNFVKDSNASFVGLYQTLNAKIGNLNASIANYKSMYNDGKPVWEWVW